MASATQIIGLSPAQSSAAESHFELGVALALNTWPALSLAVTNNWGGPDSADKRDWFAGHIIDLFRTRPDTDMEDVETVLLNVMQDEFEVVVDDESAFEVAETVMRLKGQCERGEFGEVIKMREKWQSKAGNKDAGSLFQKVERNEDDDETDGSGSEFEGFSDDDVEMGDAPPAPKEKPAPEIDEDGFQKVTGKKRR